MLTNFKKTDYMELFYTIPVICIKEFLLGWS